MRRTDPELAHSIDITPVGTLKDPDRYRWECSCGAAGTAPGWVDGAPEFHLPDGAAIVTRNHAAGE